MFAPESKQQGTGRKLLSDESVNLYPSSDIKRVMCRTLDVCGGEGL
jgi:hypothetical protein